MRQAPVASAQTKGLAIQPRLCFHSSSRESIRYLEKEHRLAIGYAAQLAKQIRLGLGNAIWRGLLAD